MQKTHSSQPLETYVYVPRGGGKQAIVYLRENIEHEVYDEPDDGSIEFWQADEVMTTTDLPESEIKKNFDALWVKAVTEDKGIEGRLAEVEEMLDATMAVVLGEE